MLRLIILALALLVAALLSACQESEPTELLDPTIAPTAAAQPTATPTHTPTATPTPAWTSTATPLPFSVSAPDTDAATLRGVLQYAAQCGTITPYVGGRRAALTWTFYEPPEATWGEVAHEVEVFLEQYAILDKPAILEEYHEANVAAWQELLQAARRQQIEQSESATPNDLRATLSAETLLALADSSMASDEVTEQIREIEDRLLGELLSQDIVALNREALDILPAFPPLIEGPLREYGCFPPLRVLSLDRQVSVTRYLFNNVADAPVLAALYIATDGNNWQDNSNWLTSSQLAEWHGITTWSEGSVRGIYLEDNGLTGEIPADLEALSQLRSLFLAGNRLTGCIPPALAQILVNDLDELNLPFCG